MSLLLLVGFVGLAAASTSRLLDCSLESKSVSDCDYKAYAGRLVGYVILPLILAVFTLFSCPFYFCFKYCCNCCGGRSATMGCCCSCGAKSAVYSTLDIIRPKVYVVVIVALALGSGAWGIASTAQTTSGLRNLADTVNATPALLLNRLNLINSSLTVSQYDFNSDSTTEKNLFSGTDLDSQGQKMKKQLSDSLSDNLSTFKTYVDNFALAMYIIFAIPMTLSVIAALCALLNIRTCIPMLTVSIMFLMGFTLWFGHGVFNAVALLSGDLCSEVHGVTQGQKTILQPISGCQDSLFDQFLDSFTSLESSTASSACNAMKTLCYDTTQSALTNALNNKVFDCTPAFSCSNVRFGDIVSLLEGNLFVHSTIASLPSAQQLGYTCNSHPTRCSPALCSDECVTPSGTRSAVGKSSRLTYVNFLAAQKVADTLDTLGAQYGSCDAIMSLLLSPFDAGCQDFSKGSLGLRDSSGLGGVITFAYIFVLAWGSKRFLALPESQHSNTFEMDVKPAKNPLTTPEPEPQEPSKTHSPAHAE